MQTIAITDVGRIRELNEDSVWAQEIEPGVPNPLRLKAILLVADGMGGHQAGEVASGLAAQTAHEIFTDENEWQDALDGQELLTRIDMAIREINIIVHDGTAAEAAGGSRPGTTLTVALLRSDEFFIGHIGDSRAYILRNGGGDVELLTEDDSFVAEAVRRGQMSESEARVSPLRHQITKAIGLERHVQPSTYYGRWSPGDLLLLCSDGLTEHVDDEMLGAIIQEFDEEPIAAIRELVSEANRCGGHDNISIAAAYNEPSSEPVEVVPAYTAPSRSLLSAPRLPLDTPATPQKEPEVYAASTIDQADDSAAISDEGDEEEKVETTPDESKEAEPQEESAVPAIAKAALLGDDDAEVLSGTAEETEEAAGKEPDEKIEAEEEPTSKPEAHAPSAPVGLIEKIEVAPKTEVRESAASTDEAEAAPEDTSEEDVEEAALNIADKPETVPASIRPEPVKTEEKTLPLFPETEEKPAEPKDAVPDDDEEEEIEPDPAPAAETKATAEDVTKEEGEEVTEAPATQNVQTVPGKPRPTPSHSSSLEANLKMRQARRKRANTIWMAGLGIGGLVLIAIIVVVARSMSGGGKEAKTPDKKPTTPVATERPPSNTPQVRIFARKDAPQGPSIVFESANPTLEVKVGDDSPGPIAYFPAKDWDAFIKRVKREKSSVLAIVDGSDEVLNESSVPASILATLKTNRKYKLVERSATDVTIITDFQLVPIAQASTPLSTDSGH